MPCAERPGAPLLHCNFACPSLTLPSFLFTCLAAAERVAAPGTAAGLVWTSVGGKLQYIECICVGEGRSGSIGALTLTGGCRAGWAGLPGWLAP